MTVLSVLMIHSLPVKKSHVTFTHYPTLALHNSLPLAPSFLLLRLCLCHTRRLTSYRHSVLHDSLLREHNDLPMQVVYHDLGIVIILMSSPNMMFMFLIGLSIEPRIWYQDISYPCLLCSQSCVLQVMCNSYICRSCATPTSAGHVQLLHSSCPERRYYYSDCTTSILLD